MEKLWKRKKRATKHREKIGLDNTIRKRGEKRFKKRDKWREEKKGAEGQNKWLKP